MSIEVQDLFVYPVKSCAGVRLDSAPLRSEGLPFDRQWMVVNDAGRARTQREVPLLALIITAFENGALVLSREGRGSAVVPLAEADEGKNARTVHLWGEDLPAVEPDAAASRWLTEAVGSDDPLRLVRPAPDFQRPHDLDESGSTESGGIRFADAAPYLIVDQASLERLNEALDERGEEAVPMNRFRPNIVIRGLDAFAEPELPEGGTSTYRLRIARPCERCVVPTIDQDTAEPHPRREPFATLRKINPTDDKPPQPLFGAYASVSDGSGAVIRIGDVWTS